MTDRTCVLSQSITLLSSSIHYKLCQFSWSNRLLWLSWSVLASSNRTKLLPWFGPVLIKNNQLLMFNINWIFCGWAHMSYVTQVIYLASCAFSGSKYSNLTNIIYNFGRVRKFGLSRFNPPVKLLLEIPCACQDLSSFP